MAPVNLRALVIQGLDRLKHFRCDLADFAHPASGEQKVVWIDMALLDEAAGLLGASARVRSVYQSALVIHEVAQVSTRAGQPLTKIRRGYFHHLGTDGVAHAKDRAQDVGQ